MSKKVSSLDRELNKCISFQNFMRQTIGDNSVVERFFRLYRKFVDVISYAKLMMYPTDKLTPTSIKKAVLIIATPVGEDDFGEMIFRIQEVKVDDDNINKVYDILKKKNRSTIKSLSKKEKHNLIEEYIIEEVKNMRDQIAAMKEVDRSTLLIDTIGEKTWSEFEKEFDKKYGYKPTAFSFDSWREYAVIRVDTRKVEFNIGKEIQEEDDFELQSGAKKSQGLSMDELVPEEQEEPLEVSETPSRKNTYIISSFEGDYRGTGKSMDFYMYGTNDSVLSGRGGIDMADAQSERSNGIEGRILPEIPSLPETFNVDDELNNIINPAFSVPVMASQTSVDDELLSMGIDNLVEEPVAEPETAEEVAPVEETQTSIDDELLSMGIDNLVEEPVAESETAEEVAPVLESQTSVDDELLSMGIDNLVEEPAEPEATEEVAPAVESQTSVDDELLSMGIDNLVEEPAEPEAAEEVAPVEETEAEPEATAEEVVPTSEEDITDIIAQLQDLSGESEETQDSQQVQDDIVEENNDADKEASSEDIPKLFDDIKETSIASSMEDGDKVTVDSVLSVLNIITPESKKNPDELTSGISPVEIHTLPDLEEQNTDEHVKQSDVLGLVDTLMEDNDSKDEILSSSNLETEEVETEPEEFEEKRSDEVQPDVESIQNETAQEQPKKSLTKEEIDALIESIKAENKSKDADSKKKKSKYDFYTVDQIIDAIKVEKEAKEKQLKESEQEKQTPKKVRVYKINSLTGEKEILTEKPTFKKM